MKGIENVYVLGVGTRLDVGIVSLVKSNVSTS